MKIQQIKVINSLIHTYFLLILVVYYQQSYQYLLVYDQLPSVHVFLISLHYPKIEIVVPKLCLSPVLLRSLKRYTKKNQDTNLGTKVGFNLGAR